MIDQRSEKSRPLLRISMIVVDANDALGLVHRDVSHSSPVLHPAVHNLLDGFKYQDAVEIEVLYGKLNPSQEEDRWDGCIHYIPIHYKAIPGMGGSFLSRTFALLRHLRRTRPDLVHGQGTERESGLIAALSGFPSLLTLHGNFRELAKATRAKPMSYFWICAKIEAWILPRLSGVHCISTHTQTSVESKARRTWVIPNAVSPEFFKVERLAISHPTVVCMAGITEWKNPLILVKASDTLHRYDPKTKIHFYGYCNPEHPYGRAFLEALESRPWCVHHGHSTQATLLNALASATCSVLPSKQENFGLALAESMAAGVAVLGANVGGIPDVIQNEVTGLLFDPDNPDELAQLLIDLHSDKGKMQRLADAGRAEAIRRFSIEAVTAAHLQMYHGLLSKPPTQ